MTEAEQLRSDLLDGLSRLKACHHALADGQNSAALVHLDVAQAQLADVRQRLAPLATRVPVERLDKETLSNPTQKAPRARTEGTEPVSVNSVPPPSDSVTP